MTLIVHHCFHLLIFLWICRHSIRPTTGLLFFGYAQKFLSKLVSLYSVQTPVSSRIKVKNPNDRSLKTLQIFVFTISDDT